MVYGSRRVSSRGRLDSSSPRRWYIYFWRRAPAGWIVSLFLLGCICFALWTKATPEQAEYGGGDPAPGGAAGGAGAVQRGPRAADPANMGGRGVFDPRHSYTWGPVSLDLKLPDKFINQPAFASRASTFTRFGFDLRTSNKLPLDRHLPDYRMPECKSLVYPALKDMPQVSVIVIFYNEAMSTLMRNIVSVLNQSPPELLGEILLVDDGSTLEELGSLFEHLDRIRAQLPSPTLIRHVRRDTHDGIVGARIRGAREATYPIILFLDSHAEVAAGWLEPLVARIHEDKTRVVIPNIRGFNLDTLDLNAGDPWPPSKGTFNWRLAYSPVMADIEKDMIPGFPLMASPVRTPVMPGGLFAMDKDYFFKLGEYDPEIKYYGAEHVELSFRVWMCGGSMENIPCSNVGHIYREFNRFSAEQDPLIQKLDIGRVLDRNDLRVATVWMDGEYEKIFTRFRFLEGVVTSGDVRARRELKQNLQCKSLQWFMDEVVENQYVPDIVSQTHVAFLKLVNEPNKCLDNGGTLKGKPQIVPCKGQASLQQKIAGRAPQQWTHTTKGYLQTAFHVGNRDLACIRVNWLAQVGCADSFKWRFEKATADGVALLRIKLLADPSICLTRRIDQGDPAPVTLNHCSTTSRQLWKFTEKDAVTGAGTLSEPNEKLCFDNLQKKRGDFGVYGCHGFGSQRWHLDPSGNIKSADYADTCIGPRPTVSQFICAVDDLDFQWDVHGDTLRPRSNPKLCLDRGIGEDGLHVENCNQGYNQRWLEDVHAV